MRWRRVCTEHPALRLPNPRHTRTSQQLREHLCVTRRSTGGFCHQTEERRSPDKANTARAQRTDAGAGQGAYCPLLASPSRGETSIHWRRLAGLLPCLLPLQWGNLPIQAALTHLCRLEADKTGDLLS